MRKDIKLSTGSVVTHSIMKNGATYSELTNGNTMTDSEWNEYCEVSARRNKTEIEAQKRARIAANHVAFNAAKGTKL